MSDDNGNVIDSFIPFSTLTEDTAEENRNSVIADDENGTAHRVGENLKIEEDTTVGVSEEATKPTSAEKSSNGLIYGIGGIILAGIAVLAGFLIKKKNCPERLQAETDNGRIYVHIDERITECEKEKWKIWNKMRATDPEYALAMKNADTAKVWQLENLFELQAKEIAIQTCLVIV